MLAQTGLTKSSHEYLKSTPMYTCIKVFEVLYVDLISPDLSEPAQQVPLVSNRGLRGSAGGAQRLAARGVGRGARSEAMLGRRES